MKTKAEQTNRKHSLITMVILSILIWGHALPLQGKFISFGVQPEKQTGLTGLAGTASPGFSSEQQTKHGYIKGTLLDQAGSHPVSYATVALYRQADSSLITGSITNDQGEFRIGPLQGGDYFLAISFVGYQSVEKTITTDSNLDYDAGIILLAEEAFSLDELVITGRRMRGEAAADKTTYYANKRIQDASHAGIDVLKHIPGVHVDFMNNVLLEGSSNIIIMVDGRQRDADYLRQLGAAQIDRVEVITSPGPGYDASVTGVLNIKLNERQSGANGHIHAEIPVNTSEVYVMPSYSLNYGTGKINLFTSYNGDIRRFDIIENSSRTIMNGDGAKSISSMMTISQKSWSHRFHYGADYIIDDRNQLNFYGFFNPYSNEHGGDVSIFAGDAGGENEHFSGRRIDEDRNHIAFYSLYYKHSFDRPGSEIAFDLSYSDRNSETTTRYMFASLPGNLTDELISSMNPNQKTASLKTDFTSQVSEAIKVEMGARGDLRRSADGRLAGSRLAGSYPADSQSDDFRHHENVLAAYGSLNYSRNNLTLNGGLRVEHSVTGLEGSFENSNLSLLPGAAVNYRLNSNQGLRLAYRRSINRPGVYQLNPHAINEDPFSLRHGNPSLVPVLHENIYLDYSVRPGSSFISMRLFYNHASREISDLTFVNGRGLLETRLENLGDTRQYGIQLSGAMNINNSVSLNPYFRIFEISSKAGELAGKYDIASRSEIAWSGGMAAIASLGGDFTASLIVNYDSPRHTIQNTTFSDALYFLSLERDINQKYKLGIMSGLPFARSFTYHGNRIDGRDFSSRSDGNIMMSAVPVWIKFRYQFSSGRQVKTIERNKEQIERRPVKGF